MLEIFDKENGSYTFPSGVQMTSKEMQADPQYAILFDKICVVDVTDGVMTSYQTLANLAGCYGIDYTSDSEEDPTEVLSKVQEIIEYQKAHPPVSLSDTVTTAAKIVALSFTDEQARSVPDLYPEYAVGINYKTGDRFTYNGTLYKVVQDHTSAEQWVPGSGTESLYEDLMLNKDGYQIWKQPSGAQDAYNKGDIVEYNDQLYKSKIDGNTWAPDVYPAGWEKYTEE